MQTEADHWKHRGYILSTKPLETYAIGEVITEAGKMHRKLTTVAVERAEWGSSKGVSIALREKLESKYLQLPGLCPTLLLYKSRSPLQFSVLMFLRAPSHITRNIHLRGPAPRESLNRSKSSFSFFEALAAAPFLTSVIFKEETEGTVLDGSRTVSTTRFF